jgi:hypothetical protein
MDSPALDPEQLAVVEQYRTCEFATLSRSGVPIPWAAATVRRADGTFLITTSIGLPQKAFNVRRDPRVAMLFSDPTGSGLAGAPDVFLEGTASCPDEIVAGPAGAEDLWRILYERQPGSKAFGANAFSRWLMDWYYMRLHITITPTAVTTRPPLAPAGAAELSGAAAALNGFSSAVLGTSDEDGSPRLLRVGLGAGVGATVTVDVPGDADVRPGPATLLAHSHDEQLWNLRSAVLVGELSGGSGGTWTFEPSRTIAGGGNQNPVALVRGLVEARRTTARYLARRELPRPRIAWAEFDALLSTLDQGSQPTRPESAA